MRAYAEYGATVVITVLLFGAIGWAVVEPGDQPALLASAALAVLIQMVAFLVARLMFARHLMLGWGLGALLRLAGLVAFALILARVARDSLTPGLLSLAVFLFVTTVVEPVFLKR